MTTMQPEESPADTEYVVVEEHPLLARVDGLLPRLMRIGMRIGSPPALDFRSRRYSGRIDAFAEEVAMLAEVALESAGFEDEIEVCVEDPSLCDLALDGNHDYAGRWCARDARFVAFYSSKDKFALPLYLFCRRDGAIMVVTVDVYEEVTVRPARTLDATSKLMEDLAEALKESVPDDTIH